MLLKEHVKDSILGEHHGDFITEAAQHMPQWIDTNIDEVPDVFKNYEYPVSPWPVLIDQKTAERLKTLCVRIPKLLNQIPALYFKDDIKKIADFYFDGNEMFAQLALMANSKNIEVSCRLDLTLNTNGFKILEANIGTSIGGWQVQSFEKIIRRVHEQLTNEPTASKYESKNIQHIYITFLVDEILKHVDIKNKEINIFLDLKHVKEEILKEYSVDFFNEMLRTELTKRGFKGNAYSGKLPELKLQGDTLYLGKIAIDSVLLLSLNMEEVSADIFRAFIMDKIYFPDHIGVAIIRDKRNLGLLRELAEQQKFSEEDNKLILKSIPWTSMITKEQQQVLFEGQSYAMGSLLRNRKDEFVVKASNGLQGKDVFIGKFSSDEEWEEAIALAVKTQAFIAQEFNESKNFMAPNASNQWTPHKLIWGAFGFGKTYGGVWVRMSALERDTGVINSATGALEAIVYECIS